MLWEKQITIISIPSNESVVCDKYLSAIEIDNYDDKNTLPSCFHITKLLDSQ